MPPLPRGICPDCRVSVAVRVGGLVREHYIRRPQAEQEPTEHLGRMQKCPGSGKTAAKAAAA